MATLDDGPAILMADDDDDDVFATRRAFRQAAVRNPFHRVSDGNELLDYLRRRGEHERAPRPGLILLDLNMPGMDGREALETIKGDPELKRIPLIVFTTSQDVDDIAACYDRGANSYIAKPVGMELLVKTARTIQSYWFELVRTAV